MNVVSMIPAKHHCQCVNMSHANVGIYLFKYSSTLLGNLD